ncbi:DUF6353 family protein [Flavobacterium sp.]|uniref:DUF6353 family protein n=1 Tax=Flavobacterium sp. TaxID=239 RepID=UPI002602DCDE|nr:DUF6353 family protein [Flavobacterium sp.]
MNIVKYVPPKVSRSVGLALLKGQKHSPTILFGAGIIGFGATVVMASRATLKLEDVIHEAEKDLSVVDVLVTEEEAPKEKAYVYLRSGVKIVKLYAPSVIVGALSVAALTSSHRILNARNAGLTAAYAVLEKGFDEYRGRVREQIGEEKERDLYQNVETTMQVDPANSKKKIKVRTAGQPSMYARFFDQTNRNWSVDPEDNRIFIGAQQTYLQQRLNQWGWVSLNDALERLGFERTKEGQQVGWVVGRAGIADRGGDAFIDFGLNDWPEASDYVNGREVAILLDFNVTTLLDKI